MKKNRPTFYKFYTKFKAFSGKAKSVTLIYCYFNYPPIKKVLNLEISPGQKKTFVVFTWISNSYAIALGVSTCKV